jgi:hypothetical protein
MKCGHKLTRRSHEHDGSLTRTAAGDAVGPLRRAGGRRVLLNKLSRYVSECEMSMDLLVAEAVLEFGNDLRSAREAAVE